MHVSTVFTLGNFGRSVEFGSRHRLVCVAKLMMISFVVDIHVYPRKVDTHRFSKAQLLTLTRYLVRYVVSSDVRLVTYRSFAFRFSLPITESNWNCACGQISLIYFMKFSGVAEVASSFYREILFW